MRRPTRAKLPLLLTLALAVLALPGAAAQTATSNDAATVRYTVHLDAPQTQVIGISIELDDIDDDTLVLQMPAWRPGRYAINDHAGTVRQLRADSGGRELEVHKTDKATWQIDTRGADTVRVDYRLYANELGLRTRHVDDSHAFLSGSSVFLYDPSRRDRPVRVRIEAPADWRIAGGLELATDDPRTLVAPSYDVLVDSPIEVGRHDLLEFEVEGVPHQIVVWPPGRRYDAERLERDFGAIVAEQARLFGDMPYRRYVFLLHVGRGAGGGTEHLNSTIMQTGLENMEASLDEGVSRDYRRLLGLTSHEMFHTWNVKQLRPAGIQPYDYQSENYSTLFWVAEGTTSYYDDLTLVRTELIETGEYLEILSEAIDAQRRRPGTRVQSLAEASFDAWVTFNRRNADAANSTVSFYSKGALVSFLLDLEIRRSSGGERSLDDLMRTLYERFPLEDGGYGPQDLQATAEEIAGSDLSAFFDDFVYGTAPLPLEEQVAQIGLELVLEPKKSAGDSKEGESDDGNAPDSADEAPSERPVLGVDLAERDGRTVVRSVSVDGPAYEAGVIADDEVVALDGVRLRAADLDKRLARYEPGDRVTLHLLRHDDLREIAVVLGQEADAEWTLRRIEEPTAEQRSAWESWIGSAWPDEGGDGERSGDEG